jgi:putative copper export protein
VSADLDAIILGIHITGAAIWVGGVVALGTMTVALRGAPFDDPRIRSLAIGRLARPLARVMWPALVVTILTGLYNASWYLPSGASLLSTPEGMLLVTKTALVGFVVVVGGLHTFLVGPRIRRRIEAGGPDASLARLRGWNAALGAATLVGSVGVLFLAAALPFA